MTGRDVGVPLIQVSGALRQDKTGFDSLRRLTISPSSSGFQPPVPSRRLLDRNSAKARSWKLEAGSWENGGRTTEDGGRLEVLRSDRLGIGDWGFRIGDLSSSRWLLPKLPRSGRSTSPRFSSVREV
jgi:hypothetical protein